MLCTRSCATHTLGRRCRRRHRRVAVPLRPSTMAHFIGLIPLHHFTSTSVWSDGPHLALVCVRSSAPRTKVRDCRDSSLVSTEYIARYHLS
jgi:hypothetical protein